MSKIINVKPKIEEELIIRGLVRKKIMPELVEALREGLFKNELRKALGLK